MITSYIITSAELAQNVPSSFFKNEKVATMKFSDYAHYIQPDELEDLYIIFIGRKVGNCYDSTMTNVAEWAKYFVNNTELTNDDYIEMIKKEVSYEL